MSGSPPVEALIFSVGIGMAILSLVITAIMDMFNLAVRIETRVMDKLSEMKEKDV